MASATCASIDCSSSGGGRAIGATDDIVPHTAGADDVPRLMAERFLVNAAK